MNFLIYGAGALGQALGCMLATAGHNVDLLLRDRFIDPIRESGLQVSGIFGDYVAPMDNIHLFSGVEELQDTYDFALITTKSYDTPTAVRDIASLGNKVSFVVSMQNGCGNLEMLEAGFGPDKSLGVRVLTGFEIIAPGVVDITVSADGFHVGGVIRGAIPDTARSLAEIITAAGHPAEVVEDIHQSLFAKLLYNCTLNPLGAILGVHYGVLAENEETRKIMDAVIEETFEVIKAVGGRTPWQQAEEYKQFFYTELIPATYNHRSSMLQDIENNKPTEVESLIGYVSSKGHLLNVPTPACDLLSNLIRFKENQ
jgi:2-dehydropantoate 2-reductase